jgi:hypothetical protein
LSKECEIKIKFKLINNFESKDVLARVFYPDEGDIILIKKGLNVIELSEAIHHEIGHVLDWYISNNNKEDELKIREENADIIGESIRFKASS